MTKTYSLKALRPLFSMAREALPLLASFDPFGDGTEPWMIRWVGDYEGFWLQVNDSYGTGETLSAHGILGMSGFDCDDLQGKKLDGAGYVYGLPGGKPILPLPFTALQLFEFDKQIGGLVQNCFLSGAEEAEAQLTELERSNPDAAELARIIFSGVMPEPQAMTFSPAPVAAAGVSDGVEADKTGPLHVKQGLPTKDIAHAFDGVNGWSADRWPRNLSASKWLHHARIAIGRAGGASSVWSPVILAQLMHHHAKGEREKEKLMKAFNSRFTRNPALWPWRDAFNEYFATHCATD